MMRSNNVTALLLLALAGVIGMIYLIDSQRVDAYGEMEMKEITIDEKETLRIARERIAKYFDIENLTPEIRLVDRNWEVQFRRSPRSPGGEPRVIIDGKTGEILEVFSTQ